MKVTWAGVTLLVIASGLVAMDVLPAGFIVGAIVISVALYAVYLWLVVFCIEGQVVALEGTRLVKRGQDNRVLHEIDLRAPFEARCEFHGSALALFKVAQGGRAWRFIVAVEKGEELARDVLHLPWSRESRAIWWV